MQPSGNIGLDIIELNEQDEVHVVHRTGVEPRHVRTFDKHPATICQFIDNIARQTFGNGMIKKCSFNGSTGRYELRIKGLSEGQCIVYVEVLGNDRFCKTAREVPENGRLLEFTIGRNEATCVDVTIPVVLLNVLRYGQGFLVDTGTVQVDIDCDAHPEIVHQIHSFDHKGRMVTTLHVETRRRMCLECLALEIVRIEDSIELNVRTRGMNNAGYKQVDFDILLPTGMRDSGHFLGKLFLEDDNQVVEDEMSLRSFMAVLDDFILRYYNYNGKAFISSALSDPIQSSNLPMVYKSVITLHEGKL